MTVFDQLKTHKNKAVAGAAVALLAALGITQTGEPVAQTCEVMAAQAIKTSTAGAHAFNAGDKKLAKQMK